MSLNLTHLIWPQNFLTCGEILNAVADQYWSGHPSLKSDKIRVNRAAARLLADCLSVGEEDGEECFIYAPLKARTAYIFVDWDR